MSDVAIRVEGLSKQFRIGAPERYRTLRDSLADSGLWNARCGRLHQMANAAPESSGSKARL